jgi:hypothetical protein
MDFFILLLFAGIVLLGLAAVEWGVDSRPTLLDPRYPTTNGLF